MGTFEHNLERFSKIENEDRGTLIATGARPVAERLVAGGAIITVPGCPVTRHLVGHLAWLEPQRIFWFTAYGDSLADAHLLEFDAAHVTATGVSFSRAGRIAGQLSPIDEAGVDDPDDYRIAWQLWQEVAPLRTAVIEECCGRLLGDRPHLRLREDLVARRLAERHVTAES